MPSFTSSSTVPAFAEVRDRTASRSPPTIMPPTRFAVDEDDVVPGGPPEALRVCMVSNESMTVAAVAVAGNNNGSMQASAAPVRVILLAMRLPFILGSFLIAGCR